jgi:trimeric autotransporter adhesin
MGKASEAILALEPVMFRYKKEIDSAGIQQFGLVAEDVEKVNPDLVVRDETGKVNSVRYEQVNAMLLNEFLKEHRRVGEQGRKIQVQEATIARLQSDAAKEEATISQLENGMGVLTAQLKEQAAEIQKVSAQIELNNVRPRTVLNDQR